MKITIHLIFLVVLIQSCNAKNSKDLSNKIDSIPKIEFQNTKRAYFASGCFWCVEAIYESIKGVKEVYSGYSGGYTLNPTYYEIGTGKTGHAETVEVIYDPSIISYITLVDVFFGSHDPTTLNQQGPDKGTQYRSIIFYENDNEKNIILNKIHELKKNKVFNSKIVTEIKKLSKFYYAEDYHQDYEKNNPDNPYVRSVSIPRLNDFKTKFPKILKNKH